MRSSSARPEADDVSFEGLTIDITGRYVYINNQKADMSPKEYKLLFYMVKNKNIALPREKLITDVWGYDFYGDDRRWIPISSCCAKVWGSTAVLLSPRLFIYFAVFTAVAAVLLWVFQIVFPDISTRRSRSASAGEIGSDIDSPEL